MTATPGPPARPAGGWAVATGVMRAVTVGLGVLLALVAPDGARALPALGAVALTGLAATLAAGTTWRRRIAYAVELAVATAAVPLTGGPESPLLPYLLAPMFAVGFQAGARAAVAASGAMGAMLVAGTAVQHGPVGDYLVTATEWTVLGLALGLIAAWARGLLHLSETGPRQRYVEAHRLLSELRGVARRLPGSLDPVSAANALLDACAAVAPVRRSAVLVPTSTGRLTPLVVRGADRLDLDLSMAGGGPVATAWRRATVLSLAAPDAPPGTAALLVAPLSGDGRPSGLVVLDSDRPQAFPPAVATTIAHQVREAAPRLEAARVFDEIRSLATVEERQRLAREIHDGIAQDLVYVGYELDNLGAEVAAGRPDAAESVRRVRDQLTRIISELRLSIFNLRSGVDPDSGLGAALTEYARTVGARTGMTVHLSLTERDGRLSPDAEAELLRIAQEAIGNARRHARAGNLWVSLVVEPPRATLRVEDDGEGVTDAPADGFGLEIMRERAGRLGARLTVADRAPRGTRVEVVLGSA